MRRFLVAAALPASLLFAAPALAGDPIMPLGEVHAGMHCTALSVVRGTDVASFGADVVDVVDDAASGQGPRIIVKVSGPAVDETGIGPGFSGSPIYCPDAQGTARNIGAISESVGEYGGKVVLATPIEAILGNPVDPPHVASGTAAARASRAHRALAATARPLAAPLTITGLSTRFGNALQRAAAKRGRALLAAPAGPLGSFAPQALRPGSAFGVGYANGDIGAGAIGTIAYTDGDRVWGFGHPLDGLGARSLLLQDAYVFRVINNPISLGDIFGTYKYAAAGHTLGTLTNDALTAVVGRVGGLPATVPVRVFATDVDRGAKSTIVTNVADEASVDQPGGASVLSLLAPVAFAQAASGVMRGSPVRLTGRACFVVSLREARKPVRFCNRYVTDAPDQAGIGNPIAAAGAVDLSAALSLIDGFKAGTVHVTGIDAHVDIRRGQQQAFLVGVRLPRHARAGRKVRATLLLQHVRGRLERRAVRLRLPTGLHRGRRAIQFTGTDTDSTSGDLSSLLTFDIGGGPSGGDPGPPNVAALRDGIDGLARFDGVSVRRPASSADDSDPGEPSYRDPRLRISGSAIAHIRITRR